MQLYCTLFDKNYISRGLAMQRSLATWCPDSTLIVLCLDQVTFDALSALNLSSTELIALESLADFDTRLRPARKNRSFVEFYWTCKPVLMAYGLKRFPSAQRVTYLDSDLYFFADQMPLERELEGSAIALTPHRFPPRLQERLRYGTFNAGWVSASSGEEGHRFIDWWSSRCLDWCKKEVEGDRFADQRYLDRVGSLFSDVRVIAHPGANVAPWNLEGLDVKSRKGDVRIDGERLLFFHFHALRRVFHRLYDSGLSDYGVSITAAVRKSIYRPYLSAIASCEDALSDLPDKLRHDLGLRSATGWLRGWYGVIKQARHQIAAGAQVVW